MSGHRDDDDSFGEVDFGSKHSWPPWGRWVLLAAVVVAAGAFLVVRHDGGTASSAPAAAESTAPSGGTPDPQPRVQRVGRRLLGVTGDWQLFVRGTAGVTRVSLAEGRLTRTPVPPLQSSGPVSFVVGAVGAIVRPLDAVPGYLVLDGLAARPLTGALASGGPAVPGPHRGTVWVPKHNGQMQLVRLDGTRVGPKLGLRWGEGWAYQSDGDGYVLSYADDTVYDVRPDGATKVASGREQLVAVGGGRWVTQTCRRRRCVTSVVDAHSHRRRVVGRRAGARYDPGGLVSPDGSVAAVLHVRSRGTDSIDLVDLSSGRVRPLGLTVGEGAGAATLAWSPDGRLLFAVAPGGRLQVFDLEADRARELGVPLPAVSQVAVRP